MTLIERAFQVAPQVFDSIWNQISRYAAAHAVKASQLLPSPIDKSPEISSITLRRSFDSASGKSAATAETDPSVEKVDGVLEYICSLDVARHIKLDKRYILNNKEEIAVTSNINAKITQMSANEKGELADLEIVISSEKLGINELRAWVDDVHRNYCFEKNNQLGQKKFYFNEMPVEPMQELMPHHGPMQGQEGQGLIQGQGQGQGKGESVVPKKNYRWDSAPKTLTFTMNEFHTAKSFRNVFGNHVAELKERLNLFVNHPDWYQARGIPHSLGILLHGIPGAGKTSTIKAVAKDTGRHIFNLSLRPYTTQKQLTHLFFNENVAVIGDDGVRQVYRIPVNQRVYVIEDIDCLTDVVYQRTEDTKLDINGDAITLSFLLNLLDGVLETPGRILIITTNHPEKLDRALVRPGRIDVNIRFEEATRQLIADMLNNFYGLTKTENDIPESLDGILTPAEVLECFCRHFKDAEAALADLVEKAEPQIGTTLADLFMQPEHEPESESDSEPALELMKKSLYISPSNSSFCVENVPEVMKVSSTISMKSDAPLPVHDLLQLHSAKVHHVICDEDLQYKPIDVTLNPTIKYGESEDHPQPHMSVEDQWMGEDIINKQA